LVWTLLPLAASTELLDTSRRVYSTWQTLPSSLSLPLPSFSSSPPSPHQCRLLNLLSQAKLDQEELLLPTQMLTTAPSSITSPNAVTTKPPSPSPPTSNNLNPVPALQPRPVQRQREEGKQSASMTLQRGMHPQPRERDSRGSGGDPIRVLLPGRCSQTRRVGTRGTRD
jgi:hypothetical protein